MPYVKLDTGILDSTLWLCDSDVRVVFITMLTMARPDGMCEATAPGIARRANLSIEATRSALRVLEAPDEDSRSLDNEGRRTVRVDGGYFIVNYDKYRQKDHTATERKRKERAKKKAEESRSVTNVTRDGCDVTPPVTQAEAKAEAKAKKVFTPPTTEEVRAYCSERGNSVDPQRFVDHYQANGWMRGKAKVKDWKACVRTWETERKEQYGDGGI